MGLLVTYRRAFIVINLLTILSHISLAQLPAKVWDKRFGGSSRDELWSIISTPTGDHILGGFTYSFADGDRTEALRGGSDYWIVKVNGQGTKIWDKRYGGGLDDFLRTIVTAPHGGFLLGGFSNSDNLFDRTENSRGAEDYWVVRVDSLGTKIWDKRFGGGGSEYLTTIIPLNDGGFILGGETYTTVSQYDISENGPGGTDYWVVRINQNGEKIWDKRFGGTANDRLNSIVATADGGFILAGHSYSGIGGDRTVDSRGDADYWIVKINAQGAKIWDRRYGGSGFDQLSTILTTADGGFLLGGASLSGSGGDKSELSRGSFDYWIVKIDSQGNKLWDKSYGGSSFDVLTGMGQTGQGNFMLSGFSLSGASGDKSESSKGSSDHWIVKIGETGTKIWDKTFGGTSNDYVDAFFITSDGHFMSGGRSFSGTGEDRSENSRGDQDYWVVKAALNEPNITSVSSTNLLCAGKTYAISFTQSGIFNTGNIYTAQLSNSSGDFSNPTPVGSMAGTTSSSFSVTIPASATRGSGYRIRIVTSNPATTSNPTNGSTITITDIMYSLKAGLWNDPTVWSCGQIPQATDPVMINHNITLSTGFTANTKRIIFGIGGRLQYSTGGRVRIGF